jgi:hypothetical protein
VSKNAERDFESTLLAGNAWGEEIACTGPVKDKMQPLSQPRWMIVLVF